MWRDPETSGKSNRAPVPTIRPSIQIFAVVGVVSSRRRPVGAAARRGAGAPSGTAVGGRGAAARVPPAESELAPRAGAGTPDGRPSNHTAPPATRPTAVRTASRTVEARRRGRVGIAGRAAIASGGVSASGGSARVVILLTAR